ncbi:MAG: hypothetical protein AAGI14_09490 [Pseudomonadota bacterium]
MIDGKRHSLVATFVCLSSFLLSFACTGLPSKDAAQSEQSNQKSLTKCNVDTAEYNRLIALDYNAFDGDVFGGWRAIDYQDGCNLAASDLILDFIDLNQETRLNEGQVRMLYWHAGQTRAYSDEKAALELFQRTYSPDPDSPWNLYVTGTIAFLNKDFETLQTARNTLAKVPVSEQEQKRRQAFLDENPNITMPPGFVTEPSNLPALNALLNCFDEPYRVAYQSCSNDPPN